MADTKKEYASNLHPKGDLDTTVYPNVKSENIIDKDTTAYTAGKVPDSSLVQKSLDSLSENLETTKIQVATNKKNIGTLQGNYTGLQYQVNTNSSDIALTKTQVETNKTNIAKNTQDIYTNTQNIENLSAVIPTDINVDANGYAILEHDGAEIAGQKKKLQVVESNFKGKITSEVRKENRYNLFAYDYFDSSIKFFTYEDNNSYGNTQSYITFTSKHSISNHSPANLRISFKDRYHNYTTGKFPLEFILNTYNSSSNNWERFDYVFPEKSGKLALTSDLDAKQSTLYRHTIEIVKDNEATLILTTESTISTEINTMDKFISAFKGSELACMCALNDANAWNIHFIGIQVGTTLNDTSMMSTNLLDTALTFADVFGTAGFTITDSVSAL